MASDRKAVDNDKLRLLRDKLPKLGAAHQIANEVTRITGVPVNTPKIDYKYFKGPIGPHPGQRPDQVKNIRHVHLPPDVRQVSIQEYLEDKKKELERQMRKIDEQLSQNEVFVAADKPPVKKD